MLTETDGAAQNLKEEIKAFKRIMATDTSITREDREDLMTDLDNLLITLWRVRNSTKRQQNANKGDE